MKKFLNSFFTLLGIFTLFLGVNHFSNTPNEFHKLKAQEIVEDVYKEKPTTLSDLQNASDSQISSWADTLSRFDGREFDYISKEGNQGELGICWAYAAVGAVEASILRNQINPNVTKSDINLDEQIVAYLATNRDGSFDSLHLTKHDTFSNSDWRSSGGYAHDALLSMTQGYSLMSQKTSESSPSYNDAYIKSLVKNSQYFVKSYIPIEHNEKAIKEAILKYGSVTMEYKAPERQYDTYVYHSGDSLGHASLIVGWDDSVSKNVGFYPNTPSSDGAWIVKNSWGYGGELYKGVHCFYLSYDAYLSNNLFVAVADSKENYQNIYYYDGSISHDSTQYIADAHGVIYEAKLSSPSKQEQLKAIALGVLNDEIELDIKIYRHLKVNPGNVNDPTNNPENGELALETKQYIEKNGFYTIDLGQTILLDQGEYFSIVVSGKDQKNNPYFPYYAGDYYESINDMCYRKYNDVWETTANSKSTYADSSSGPVIRLRALTNVVSRNEILPNDLQYARVDLSDPFIYYEKGKNIIPDIKVYMDGKLLSADDYEITSTQNTKPGSVTVTIKGKNSYIGTRIVTYEIAKPKYPPNLIKGPIEVYNNITHLHQIRLPIGWVWKEGDITLANGLSDFSYAIEYIGEDAEYYMTTRYSIKVNKLNQSPPIGSKNINNVQIDVIGEYFYQGKAIIPEIQVIDQGFLLVENVEYSLSYNNNVNAGFATIIIQGIGQYVGKIEKTFEIKKALKPSNIPNNLTIARYIKTLKEIKLASPWIWKDENEVISSKSYVTKIIYNGEDKNNYEQVEFEITLTREDRKSIGTITELKLEETLFTYDGTQKKPNLIAKDGNYTLVKDVDYFLEYQNNINASSAALVTINGINNYTGSMTLQFTIQKAKRENVSIILNDFYYLDSFPIPKIVGLKENGTLTYTYSTEENGVYTNKKPTETGTYWIRVEIGESKNYLSTTLKTSFNILPLANPSTVPNSEIIISRNIKTVGEISLPAGWNWESPSLELKDEETKAYAIYEDQKNYQNYRHEVTIKKAEPKDITALKFSLEESLFYFNGQKNEPHVHILDENYSLILHQDYEVTYQNNYYPGTGKIIIQGIHDYKGTKELEFTIEKGISPKIETEIQVNEDVSSLEEISLPEGFIWDEESSEIKDGVMHVKARYIGEDAKYYENVDIEITLIINRPQKENNMWMYIVFPLVGISSLGLICFVLLKKFRKH